MTERVLLLNHGANVVRVLEVVPSRRQESWRNLAEEVWNIVQKDEYDKTCDDTIGNVV